MSTGEPLVLDLHEVRAGAGELVGGKAANLGEMIGAELPVPEGFVLTTHAYRAVAGPLDLTGAAKDPAAARELVRTAPVPADLVELIATAYGRLGQDVPVAVRSSATAEDLPFASFAGQQDTYLNVVGAQALLDAVRRCWASLWTDRAVSYRETNRIEHATVRLAVVVQRMVEAEVAGVMFTANPVTGRRDEVVVDASPGLGEAVVSGSVNPDHFVLDGHTGAIRQTRLGDKLVVIRGKVGGGTEEHTRGLADDQPCLSPGQLRDLVTLGRRVQQHYGSPQDTEWAIDAHGTLWLTQARPITTLFPLPRNDKPGLRVYFNGSVAQGVYRPLTPAGVAGLRLATGGIAAAVGFRVPDPKAGPPIITESAGRLFVDVTPMMRSTIGRRIVPTVLDLMEARSAQVLRGLFDDERLSVTQRSPWPFLRGLARVARRTRAPIAILGALRDPARARDRAHRTAAEIERLLTVSDELTHAQRLAFVESAMPEVTGPRVARIMPLVPAGFVLTALAGKLLGADGEPDELQAVLRGIPHNPTTEMDLDLWRLATAIRADPAAARELLDTPREELLARHRDGSLTPVIHSGLTEFLRRYGHRAVAEIDLGVPRWSEDPAHVLGVLANYLRAEHPELAADVQFARSVTEAEAKLAELVARVGRHSRIRGRLLRFTLDRVRGIAGLRELPKYLLVLTLARMRAQLLVLGEELASRGLLAAAEDVFFLDTNEVRAALGGADHRELVSRRQAEHERELRRKHLPRVLLSDGAEPEAAALANAEQVEGALTGTAASAGSVTGIARVVLDPTGAHLEPGEILIAPSTDPGWTPLFLTAGGLVMEMGGPNSHGAVVAREYGIPAVVGVSGATARISSGQRVTVNGSSGQVTLDEM
ncbi:PEP/pyruvate-binding domain-containing protein [Crossiella sp. CA-258035]|uniref:PEP/pyruvate-binding domain-containing protein n=1 Tax=Crossiella sp. CA-258035 TaxID=2981138 RepID=UPI0024BD4ED9|nr:PEP/pyruvate-binding domain-containing protein [Crossiella sp. CA-258035]WHT21041.1 PEP/pyruvate-binding domain-containing protein [Crossiella sp. CA-258035]